MKAQNLGKRVISIYDDNRAFVSFDRKYLFFASDRVDPEFPDGVISLGKLKQIAHVHANSYEHLYWVNAKIIEELKPEELK